MVSMRVLGPWAMTLAFVDAESPRSKACFLSLSSRAYSVGAVPDYDVTFAYINFRQKDFPVSDFQHGDGHTESQ